MKRLVYIMALLFLPVFGFGQLFQPMPNFYRPIDPATIQKAQSSREEKVDFGLTVGTGFTSYSGHSMMNSYLAPSIDYRVNSDLTLNFTGVISNFNQSPFGGSAAFNPSENGLMPLSTDNSSYSISAGGTYQPNDRMYVRAQGQFSESSMSPFSLYPGQNNQSQDFHSFSLGMGYKITENTSIDFGFRFSEGNNPFYNPYSPYNSYNSFHSFNRTRPWW